MLSFDASIQKSADLKTQSSSGSWLERVLLTPYQHRRMNFQWPLLLNPLKKPFEGAEDVDTVPLCTFLVTIWKIQTKKFCLIFFLLFFFYSSDFLDFLSFFQWPLLFHLLQKHFEGVDNVDGVPIGTFFLGQFRKIKKEKKNCSPFFLFFSQFFLLVWFFFDFLKTK